MPNIYRNLLVFFISLIFILILAEGGARLLKLDSVNMQERYLTANDRFFFTIPINRKDPYLFWRLKPKARFGKISTNSKGFRGKEFPEEKRSGTLRVFTIGDSCTMGVGIADNETYASVLENILNNGTRSSSKYEVINAGVAGYTSLQGLRYLKTEIIKYRPDIVTVQFGFNDYLYTVGPDDKNVPENSRLAIYLDDMLDKSFFYRFLKRRAELFSSPVTMYPPKRRVELSDFKQNLKEVIAVANRSGVKILLLNLPVRSDVPLVVNAIPIPKDSKDGIVTEWLRPAVIDNKNYYIQADFDGPTSVLEEYVEKYPRSALAHYFLARRYESSGDKIRAEAEFKKAKETDTDREVINEYNMAIRGISEEMRIPMVDLVSLFESRKAEALFLDERHTSAKAHAIIAEEIYNTLKAHKLIE